MLLEVEKVGDTLGLKFPKNVVDESDIKEGMKLDLTLDSGKIILSSITNKELRLDELLSQITRKNLHSLFDTGEPIGKEIW